MFGLVPDGFSMVLGNQIKSCCWRWWWRCMHNHVQVSWESCYGCPLEIIFMPAADTTKTIKLLPTNQKSLKWKTLISSAYSVTQQFWAFSKRKKTKQFWNLEKLESSNFLTIFVLSGNTVWPQITYNNACWILTFSTNFCHKKVTCLVTLFDCKNKKALISCAF